ncbi:conserved hypothetical protein [Ricinus communis]|uniref:Uncharacterized protein n=1 Tax=Ricinus communis TaxID=3988 RepID=B9T9R9_RICCO|nr:conserved hypothetical protein [Ricinus communis]
MQIGLEQRQLAIFPIAFERTRVNGIAIVAGALLRRVVDDQDALQRPAALPDLGQRLQIMPVIVGVMEMEVVAHGQAAQRGAAPAPDEMEVGRIGKDAPHHFDDIAIRCRRPDRQVVPVRARGKEGIQMRAPVHMIAEYLEIGGTIQRRFAGVDQRFVEVEDEQAPPTWRRPPFHARHALGCCRHLSASR